VPTETKQADESKTLGEETEQEFDLHFSGNATSTYNTAKGNIFVQGGTAVSTSDQAGKEISVAGETKANLQKAESSGASVTCNDGKAFVGQSTMTGNLTVVSENGEASLLRSKITGDVAIQGKKDVSFGGNTVKDSKITSLVSEDGKVIANNSQIGSETTIMKGKGLDIHFPSMQIKGRELLLDAPGISHIPSLYTQSGIYNRLNISDTVQVKTTGHVGFNQSLTSASTNFFLDTDSITVNHMVHLKSPGINHMYANKGDFILGYGSIFEGGTFADIYASGDYHGSYYHHNYNWTCKHNTQYVQNIDFRTSKALGGAGIAYTYTDPETGIEETRSMGLRVRAGNQITGTAMNFEAGGDVVLTPQNGYSNKGVSQFYMTSYYKEDKWKEYTRYFNTKFFDGSITSNGGKVIVNTNRVFYQEAGEITSAQGLDLYTKAGINTPGLSGQKGYKTKDCFAGKTERYESFQGLQDTIQETHFSGPVRHVSQEGDIIMPGLQLYAPNSHALFRGEHLVFERPILDNWSKADYIEVNTHFNFFKDWKNLSFIQSVKDCVGHLKNGEFQNAFTDIAAPSVQIDLDHVTERSKYQTLGAGSMYVGEITLESRKGILQGNGYDIDVIGDAHITTPIYDVRGAKLNFSSKRKVIGEHVGISLSGVKSGVHGSYTSTKGHNYSVAGLTVGGNLSGDIGLMRQKGGFVQANSSEADIGRLESKSTQDVSNTKFASGSVSVGVTWAGTPFVEYSGSGTPDRIRTRTNTPQRSGLYIGTATPGFSLGSADLTGAKLKIGNNQGASIGPIYTHRLPKEMKGRGLAFSYSGSTTFDGAPASDYGTVGGSYMNDGKTYSASFTIPNTDAPKDPNAPTHLWNSIGSVGYDNGKGFSMSAPIITSINGEGWRKFGQNLQWAGGTIRDGAQYVWSTMTPYETTFIPDTPIPSIEPSLEYVIGDLNSMIDFSLPEMKSFKVPSSDPLPFTGINYYSSDFDLLPNPGISTSFENSSFGYQGISGLNEQYASSGFNPEWFPFSALRPILVYGSHPHGNGVHFSTLGQLEYPPAIRSFTSPAYGAGPLEALFDPLTFNGPNGSYTFGHRMTGTNFYLEDPSLLNFVQNARTSLGESPSVYGQRSFGALNDPETAVLFFNNANVPDGNAGIAFTHKNFVGRGVHGPYGSQYLNGDYVGIGALGNDPYCPLSSQLGHEGGHMDTMHSTSGYFTPGYVHNNPQLTQQNMTTLFESYASDARSLGYERFSLMPQSVANAGQIEGVLMFNAPWQYFENTFKSGLVNRGIFLPDSQLTSILSHVEHDFMNGMSPSSKYFKGPSYVTDGVGLSLLEAEKAMASEIPTFFTEADLRKPGIASQWGSNTHEFLTSLEPGNALSNASSNHWWQNPGWKTAGKYGLPIADWGLHVGIEAWQGYDFADSISRGTVKTAIDTAVYTPIYAPISYFAGWPVALGIGAASVGAHFLPDYSFDEISSKYGEMSHFAEIGDPQGYYMAKLEARNMAQTQALKDILTFPAKISEFVFEKVGETLSDPISDTIRYQQIKAMNDGFAGIERANKILSLFGMEPKYKTPEILTSKQIMQEVSHQKMNAALEKLEANMKLFDQQVQIYNVNKSVK